MFNHSIKEIFEDTDLHHTTIESIGVFIQISLIGDQRHGDCPNMLFLTVISDSRVGYWEGAKMVDKLRDMKTDKNEIFLRTDFSALYEFTHFSIPPSKISRKFQACQTVVNSCT